MRPSHFFFDWARRAMRLPALVQRELRPPKLSIDGIMKPQRLQKSPLAALDRAYWILLFESVKVCLTLATWHSKTGVEFLYLRNIFAVHRQAVDGRPHARPPRRRIHSICLNYHEHMGLYEKYTLANYCPKSSSACTPHKFSSFSRQPGPGDLDIL